MEKMGIVIKIFLFGLIVFKPNSVRFTVKLINQVKILEVLNPTNFFFNVLVALDSAGLP